MNEPPTRTAIDDQYTWDLSSVFESPDAWERELSAVEERLADLQDGEGDLADGDALLGTLETYEEVLRRTQRLELYARAKRNEDTEEAAHEERLRRAERLDREVTKRSDAVARAVVAAGSDAIERMIERTPGLSTYERFLRDVLRRSAHVRSPEVEALLAEFSDVVESPDRVFTTLTNNDVDPEPVEGPDGDRVAVSRVNLGTHLRHPDRAFRRRAYRSVHGAYADVGDTIARVYADKVRAQVALAEARNYGSVREMAFDKPSYPETGIHVDLPTEVHDALLEAVRGSLEPRHRYDERRRRTLGVDRLRAWDLAVPLVDGTEPTVPYDRACEYVLEAVEPLGRAYRDRLEEFLVARRVDVYETRRKQNILGYAISSYDDGSYLLLNYDDDVRSLSILAHELGHAMHVDHLREARRPVYATGPRPIEEVPSYVHEFLLARHLVGATDRGSTPGSRPSEALRRYARDRLLSTIAGGLYGAGMHSAFTHEAYQVVEGGGELTRERLDGLYAELRSAFHGPLEVDECVTRSWLVGSHARKPYHSYQYVLGITAALDVVERLLDGELSPEAYREFLEGGGTVRSVEAFERLGLDVRSPDPFERACATFGRYLDEFDEPARQT